MCGSDIFLGIIAILFPPIAVWVKRGICSADSLINIALCCLGFLPGLLHAWYIISVYPEPTYTALAPEDPERGHVTYYYIQHQHTQPRSQPQGQDRGQGYGTVNKSAPNQQWPVNREGFVQPPTAASQPLPGGSRVRTDGREGTEERGDEVPPSYQQAVGDHKVQGP